jgi:hypothetical protein
VTYFTDGTVEGCFTGSVAVGYPDILKEVKVLISLDERLLKRLDRAAANAGLSRSAYISQMASRELGLARGPGATAASRAALSRLTWLFAQNPHQEAAAAIRAERDAR